MIIQTVGGDGTKKKKRESGNWAHLESQVSSAVMQSRRGWEHKEKGSFIATFKHLKGLKYPLL